MTQMHQDNIGKHMEDFLHKRRYEDYLWSFDDEVEMSDRSCYVLNFISMHNNRPSHGKIYIDKEDYEFHKKISGFGGADFIEINLKKNRSKVLSQLSKSTTSWISIRFGYLAIE